MTYWGPSFPPPMPYSEPNDPEEEHHARPKALPERPGRLKTLRKHLEECLQRFVPHSGAR